MAAHDPLCSPPSLSSSSLRLTLTALTIAAFAFSAPREAAAEPLFVAPFLSFETRGGPAVLGDLNGDGRLDLVTGGIDVLLGNGDGSEAFAIDGIVGVENGASAQFALRGVTPNPAQHELRVSFSLRDSRPATLALFDVSGRQLESRHVEGMGPGWHTVTLGERSRLSAGLYIIRLTQEGQNLTARAAVVR
jgi:hypothetical protein